MTKARHPPSAEWALMKSIAALEQDDDGLTGFTLARKITGRSKSALYRAMNPDDDDERERAPVYLADIESIDLALVRQGKRPVNLDALRERHAAAAAGIDGGGDPFRLLDMAFSYLRDALEMIRASRGDVAELRARVPQLSDLSAEMTRLFVERDRRMEIRPELRAARAAPDDRPDESERPRLVVGGGR